MGTVAETIAEHRDAIMNLWTERAERTAAARGLSEPELRNMLPHLLSGLSDGAGPEALRGLLDSHLARRIRQGFELSEIIEEFILLEGCASSVWTALPEQDQPTDMDRRAFSEAVQRMIVLVSDLFNEHMQLDEQREKRYLRLLQSIADEALRLPLAPLESRLRDALEVILEAIGADALCMLVFETATERLLSVASAGSGAEELATFVTPADRSFRSTVISEGGSTHLDVDVRRIPNKESLRASGIESLVVLQLPSHHELLAVLAVGLRETRALTARELRRLEALGDRLLLHLDNAQMYAALRRHIEELGVERELRERFVAVLAHDLRGPLSAAKMSSQLILRRPEVLAERRDLAVRLERNLDRMDRMIRDLLDVSRVRAGQRLPLRLDSCDLGALAHDVVEELSATYGERFQLVMAETVRGVWSYDELRRALWNLGTNAVKFGASNSPISIRIERTRDGARLSVHNEGKPIPHELQGSLFDLYAMSNGAVRPGGGWGLGLALVRACADAHGGHVDVDSHAGAGTTFSIVLPSDSRPFQHSTDAVPAREPPASATELAHGR